MDPKVIIGRKGERQRNTNRVGDGGETEGTVGQAMHAVAAVAAGTRTPGFSIVCCVSSPSRLSCLSTETTGGRAKQVT